MPGPLATLAELPPPAHDPETARRAADEILARPEYDWEADRSLLDRVGQWIADRLDDVLGPLGIGGSGVPVWVGWLVVAALAVAIGLMVYRSRAGWRRSAVPRSTGARHVVVVGEDESTDWEAEVARCEAEGLWRDAVRARFRVLVADLARRRVLGDLVGRTAGELVAEVRTTAPGSAAAFARAADAFEDAWYGSDEVTRADRDRFVAAADEARGGVTA